MAGNRSSVPVPYDPAQWLFGNTAVSQSLLYNRPILAPFTGPPCPDTLPSIVDVEIPKLNNIGGFSGQQTVSFAMNEPAKSAGHVWYAIPREVAVDALQGVGNKCDAKAPDDDSLRRALGLPFWSAMPGATSPSSSIGGSVASDPTGLGIVELRGDYAISTRYTKLAVGAGSVGVIETQRGVALVDAGVGPHAHAELTAHVLNEIDGLLNGRKITEILITHLHEDHTSLLPKLAEKYPITTIRVNEYQRLDPRMIKILQDTAVAQSERISQEILAREAPKRAAWEASEESGLIKADQPSNQAAWEAHLEKLKQAELARSGITLETLVPDKGVFRVVRNALVDTIELPPGTGEPVLLRRGLLDVDPVTGLPRVSTSQPEIVKDIESFKQEQKVDPAARVRNDDADANETTYIIEMGEARMYVLPDKRGSDFTRKRRTPEGEARSDTDFKAILENDVKRLNEALTALGKKPAKLASWDLSHHMQDGFVTTISQMEGLIENMHSLVRVVSGDGAASVDVVIVSGHGDPGNPATNSLIDPATVWLLRELGIEVYIASTEKAVRLLEVLTPTGKTIAGVAGDVFQGEIPSQALLRQSEAALRHGRDQLDVLEKSKPKSKGLKQDVYREQVKAHNARIDGYKELIISIETQRRAYLEAFTEKYRGPEGAGVVKPAKVDPAVPDPKTATTAVERTALTREALKATLADPRLAAVPVEAGPSSSIFDPVALTLIKQPAWGFTEEQKALAEAIAHADHLRAKVLAADSMSGRVELVVHLGELSRKLEQYAEKAPAGTKELLKVEVSEIIGEIKRYTAPSSEQSGGVSSHTTADGRYGVKQSFRVEGDGARSGADLVRWGADKTTRPLGALMVFTQFEHLDKTMKGIKEGEITVPEALLGTASSVYGITIGVRMLQKVHVGMGSFAILAVLDILETGVQSYDSPEARKAAITSAILRNGLQLGLGVVGTRMMMSGNVYLAAAGFLLQFIVDPVLNALGVYDWIERKWDFLPDDVKKVEQKLRKLVQEYYVIVGLIELSKRHSGENAPSTERERDALAEVKEELDEYRWKALSKERDVLAAFSDGYREAERSYAGLIELDTMRAQFIELQYRAHSGDPDVAVSRKQASDAFARIESTLGDEAWTEEQVNALPQWRELSSQISELSSLLSSASPDWDDVLEREKRLSQVLQNARYRVAPESRGMRSAPVLHPKARTAYEGWLNPFQEEADELHDLAIRKMNPFLTVLPDAKEAYTDPPSEVAVFRAELAFGAYERELANAGKLTTFAVERLKNNSADAATAYPEYVDKHEDYKAALTRLELAEMLLLAALERVRETSAEILAQPECTVDSGRIQSLDERARAAIESRTNRGIWFKRESKARVQQIRAVENLEMAARLGETGVLALSYPEQVAIHEVDLPYSTGGTISDRLNAIPELSRRGPDGYMIGVYRYVGWNAPASKNILVGNLKRTEDLTTLFSDADVETHLYIPLNDAAVDFFSGKYMWVDSDGARLGAVPLEDDEVDDLQRIRYEEFRK